MDPAPELSRKKRGMTAVNGALALVSMLLIVQMWLLSAALESFLAGHLETALPAAIISGIFFLFCLALYLFVDRLDRDIRNR